MVTATRVKQDPKFENRTEQVLEVTRLQKDRKGVVVDTHVLESKIVTVETPTWTPQPDRIRLEMSLEEARELSVDLMMCYGYFDIFTAVDAALSDLVDRVPAEGQPSSKDATDPAAKKQEQERCAAVQANSSTTPGGQTEPWYNRAGFKRY